MGLLVGRKPARTFRHSDLHCLLLRRRSWLELGVDWELAAPGIGAPCESCGMIRAAIATLVQVALVRGAFRVEARARPALYVFFFLRPRPFRYVRSLTFLSRSMSALDQRRTPRPLRRIGLGAFTLRARIQRCKVLKLISIALAAPAVVRPILITHYISHISGGLSREINRPHGRF